ncbi:MAG TPA: hypothetical protein PKY30_21315 [Myxococcota bacterium]|nr:hypothetical protein [Myxococcota bacterium]HNH49597.1 hypothetical protein [Myxococcota bacterium]
MTRSFYIFLIFLAVGLAWLSYGDRMSPLAVTVVEVDQRLGVPANVIVGAVGVIGLLLSLRNSIGSRDVAPPPRRAPAQGLDTDWKRRVHEDAAGLPLEVGAHIEHDKAGVALTLVLQRLPPERARRCIDVFCTFLARIPAPPRARIRFVDCADAGLPRHNIVQGIARRHLGESLHVTAHDDMVDIRFLQPDPRW